MRPVRSDRRHRFPASPSDLWASITDVSSYPRWWPWMTDFDGGGFAAGSQWSCRVKPPVPYVLRLEVLLEEVEAPRFVTASIAGDITGHAAIDITVVDGGSELRLVTVLRPANRWLRAVGTAAPAIAQLGHDWVLDTGLRQFRARTALE